MKAFILVAGEGTRLQPLTYQYPKPMLPIINKPALAHVIGHLASCGVHDIMLNPGYKGNLIENYFGDGSKFGVSVTYLPEFLNINGEISSCIRGSASSLAAANRYFNYFDESAFVICGDALIDLDMQEAMAQHKRSGAAASIILQEVDPKESYKYGIAKLNSHSEITEFVEKPKVAPSGTCLANTGIYILEPEAVSLVNRLEGVDIGNDLIPLLVAKGLKVLGQTPTFEWLDVGTLSDYLRVNHLVHHNGVKGAGSNIALDNVRQNRIQTGLNCVLNQSLNQSKGTVTLGSGCVVDTDVSFMGSVIVGNNSVIGSGSRISNCVISAYCRVPKNSVLENVILTEDWLITFDENGEMVKTIRLNSGDSRPYFQTTQVIQATKPSLKMFA